jgi:hypothetical protein
MLVEVRRLVLKSFERILWVSGSHPLFCRGRIPRGGFPGDVVARVDNSIADDVEDAGRSMLISNGSN